MVHEANSTPQYVWVLSVLSDFTYLLFCFGGKQLHTYKRYVGGYKQAQHEASFTERGLLEVLSLW